MSERIYVQTNDAERNEIVAFDRSAEGRLEQLGTFDTGGRGTGKPHLASQSSVVLNGDGTMLLVTNAGSDEVSLFTVEPDGLLLVAQAPSAGSVPTSIARSMTHEVFRRFNPPPSASRNASMWVGEGVQRISRLNQRK